jgi:NCAIR mutase (PurE)-related protein
MMHELTADVRFDWMRSQRTGVPEVVFSEGKPLPTLLRILMDASERGQSLLLTRLSPEVAAELAAAGSPPLDFDPLSRTAFLGRPRPPIHDGLAAVVCAGSSDLAVAQEAVRALEFLGAPGPLYADVGVAGLWRLLDVAEELRRYRIIVAVAGMEGALFSVLAGLVPALVIAVPSSVGYGVGKGGSAALSSALSSCAPGVVTVNIDNGFGAAAAAVKVLSASA